METKQCTVCKKILPLNCFYTKKRKAIISYYSECISCKSERTKKFVAEHRESFLQHKREYYQKNKETLLKGNRERYRRDVQHSREIKRKYAEKHRDKILLRHRNNDKETRKRFLEMYGNKCSCCGETTYEFLTIEHKLGQKGIKHSKKETGVHAYKEAIKEYRPDIYEILCMNCNFARGRYGYCPHVQSRS